ncbi:MAG: hypothetical protein Q4E73_02160 [Lachnospiraceae bacterium]|nr:hypothetical protein [Lachnospiraceae bacterium]
MSRQGFIADKRLLGSKSGGTADMAVRPDEVKRYGWMVFLLLTEYYKKKAIPSKYKSAVKGETS